jgi:Ca2+-binding EF-hand superfamily protein
MFLSGKATKELLFAECGFAELDKDGFVSKEDFIELYTDVSMGTESTDHFIRMVSSCWNIDDANCVVHKQHLTHLVALIRQKLISMSGRQSDEYVLRTVFKEFDVNKDGTLSASEFQALLLKL